MGAGLAGTGGIGTAAEAGTVLALRTRMTKRDRALCYLAVFQAWSRREAVRLWKEMRNRLALRTRFKLLWRGAHRGRV